VDEFARALLEMGFSGIYEKRRVRADLRSQDVESLAPSGPVLGEPAPETYVVDENGMNVHIDLEDGLSTGLFVDMRESRLRARSWARGGRVLNLFCYTCSFSVSAALSGATTTNVDLSAKALARGRANFEENGLDPHRHRFLKEDAMKFLARASRRGDRFDFIVLDPPSFATVGKGTFNVKNQYGQAVAHCLRVLERGGRLLCVTNHTKTTPAALVATIRAAADEVGVCLRTVKRLSPGLDVPDGPNGPFPSKAVYVEVE
jgi:23S rRNA (cytosine1962-C5)-methyltransferase